MTRSVKQKLVWATLLTGGVAYLLLSKYLPFTIPCVFHEVTGLYCPGCGMTHLLTDLLHLRFADAFRQNVMVSCLLLFWLPVGLIRLLFRPKALAKDGKLTEALLIASTVLLVLFGILRNLPFGYFLRPLYSF